MFVVWKPACFCFAPPTFCFINASESQRKHEGGVVSEPLDSSDPSPLTAASCVMRAERLESFTTCSCLHVTQHMCPPQDLNGGHRRCFCVFFVVPVSLHARLVTSCPPTLSKGCWQDVQVKNPINMTVWTGEQLMMQLSWESWGFISHLLKAAVWPESGEEEETLLTFLKEEIQDPSMLGGASGSLQTDVLRVFTPLSFVSVPHAATCDRGAFLLVNAALCDFWCCGVVFFHPEGRGMIQMCGFTWKRIFFCCCRVGFGEGYHGYTPWEVKFSVYLHVS